MHRFAAGKFGVGGEIYQVVFAPQVDHVAQQLFSLQQQGLQQRELLALRRVAGCQLGQVAIVDVDMRQVVVIGLKIAFGPGNQEAALAGFTVSHVVHQDFELALYRIGVVDRAIVVDQFVAGVPKKDHERHGKQDGGDQQDVRRGFALRLDRTHFCRVGNLQESR